VHRDRHRDRLARRAGARRHGLHRGDRRAQYLRDARITTIYEGTTGIQALGTARFYAEHILPLAQSYKHEVVHGATSTLALDESQF
jgi:hypothetical protein